MPRELKFRCWDVFNKEFLQEDEFTVSSIGDVLVEPFSERASKLISGMNYIKPENALILTQFTGLKDSEGKEIYEGDIVDYPSSIKDIRLVEIENCQFSFIQYYESANQFTVIGNIYENPELMEK